ncbi:glycosyl transferase family 90 [Prochlorococcus sp. MIT 1300]|uniref:glycosyl transferase family 90 n=1 Tax=Prochlorococcus sp. MIT 1300 TaxID=3096218 RepID=UPI002A75987D|nr:glycosyl transferase family 90 [Prochlorococcus sp. MIT 1300]
MKEDLLHVEATNGCVLKINRPNMTRDGMEQRLDALINFSENAAIWFNKLGYKDISFAVQIHDQSPREICFRFDAPLIDDGKGPLIPDPYALMTRGFESIRTQLKELPDWQLRIPLAIWRGSSTGIKNVSKNNIDSLPRYKLCKLSKKFPGLLDARLISVVQVYNQEEKLSIENELKEKNMFAAGVHPFNLSLHKWQIDIDGNVNSWGLLWKLLSGCCILRVRSKRQQWYHKYIKPWIHYIPIAPDLSDLKEKLEWCKENTFLCYSIANEGRTAALDVVSKMDEAQKQAVTIYSKTWL